MAVAQTLRADSTKLNSVLHRSKSHSQVIDPRARMSTEPELQRTGNRELVY